VSCYHPLRAFRTPTGVVFNELARHDILGRIDLPCGQCLGCRLKRARDWSLRIVHESSLYEDNCFVTLTYGRDKLPPDGSLCYRDYQLFMKRLRKANPGRRIRFFMCGEYGPLNLRPHYHACLFNINFVDRIPIGKSASGAVFFDSAILRDLWSHGHVSVQDLNRSAAAYCARYIVDKVTGDAAEAHYRSVDSDGVVSSRLPEFCHCSLKPGIGSDWFRKFGRDIYPHDFVIAEGRKERPPKYYDKLLKRSDRSAIDDIKYSREVKSREFPEEATDARLRVREQVHTARLSTKVRSM